jgi:DNA-binding transcriptional LysR family regulator
MMEMLNQGEVDLVVTTSSPMNFTWQVLRTSPTLWYCAADYIFQRGEAIPLVLLDEPSPYRDMAIDHLNEAGIPWRISYVASTLAAVRAAVKAGLGVTARPVEMMSPELRVMGAAEGLPMLPDTEYLLCRNPDSDNELALAIFNAMESSNDPYNLITAGQSAAGFADEDE